MIWKTTSLVAPGAPRVRRVSTRSFGTPRARALAALAVTFAVAGSAAAAPAPAQETGPRTRRVSSPRFGRVEGRSLGCDVSAGGRVVTFESASPALVHRDTNDMQDVFARVTGEGVDRVSVTSREKQSRTYTSHGSVSADGRFVAFDSSSFRLTRDDGSARSVFARDTLRGKTTRVSVRSDGRRVHGGSSSATISGNGRFVAFTSSAPDLAMRGDDNGRVDVFVHDRETGKTNRVSLSRNLDDANNYSEAPSISHDGRYVAYASYASNVVRGDRNDAKDVFVYDRNLRRSVRVSVTSDGSESAYTSEDPAISGDGRFVSFHSYGPLVDSDVNERIDVYVHDLVTGTTELVSTAGATPADGDSDSASISYDGRYVAFLSTATNLVAGDTNGAQGVGDGRDVFVRDRLEGETNRVNVGNEGQEGTHSTQDGRLSPDGAWVCWSTGSTNLDDDDGNNTTDVFLRGPLWD